MEYTDLNTFFNTNSLSAEDNIKKVEEEFKAWDSGEINKVSLKQKTAHVVELNNDPVNHPKHYTSHPSGVECIEITEHYNFCIGNAIKYMWRCGLKNDSNADPRAKQIEDLKKAIWYINREIKNLESNKYE